MKELKNARIWSNNILKEVCKNLKGSVINVSGELDSDKEGGIIKIIFWRQTVMLSLIMLSVDIMVK